MKTIILCAVLSISFSDIFAVEDVHRSRRSGRRYGRLTYNDIKIGWLNMPNLVGEYLGDILDDQAHGNGEIILSNGDNYKGEFEYGQPHGQGTFTVGRAPYAGQSWRGGFKNGFRHGYGVFTWPNGGVYKGDQFENTRTGEVTGTGLYYRHGDQSIGQRVYFSNSQLFYERSNKRKSDSGEQDFDTVVEIESEVETAYEIPTSVSILI